MATGEMNSLQSWPAIHTMNLMTYAGLLQPIEYKVAAKLDR